MGLLNGDISLERFNAGYIYNGRRLCDFFVKHGASRVVDLPERTKVWKCTSFHPRMPYTPWWAHEELYATAISRCRSLDCSLRLYARSRLAVAYDWDPAQRMEYFLRVELVVPVRAFVGPARGVPVEHDSVDDRNQHVDANKLCLIGGDEQYCIPNLRPEHLRMVTWTSADNIPARVRMVGA